MYLPLDFFCSVAYYELRKENKRDLNALNEMSNALKLRGFFGGIILRGEGHKNELTCNIKMLSADKKLVANFEKKDSLLNSHTVINLGQLNVNASLAVMLNWSEMNFSQFAFDLVALLKGTYEFGRLSSFHGFGTSNKIESEW